MSNNPIRDLVKFGEGSIPVIEARLRDEYETGYNARIQGKPRKVSHSRRRGAWKKGWDDADEFLAKKKSKSKTKHP